MIHLNFSLYEQTAQNDRRHAEQVMRDLGIADAAITDHLHTRLEQDAKSSDQMSVCFLSTQWAVTDNWANKTRLVSGKLSAYLAAHIVRLGLPRELIDGMEQQ